MPGAAQEKRTAYNRMLMRSRAFKASLWVRPLCAQCGHDITAVSCASTQCRAGQDPVTQVQGLARRCEQYSLRHQMKKEHLGFYVVLCWSPYKTFFNPGWLLQMQRLPSCTVRRGA